jgi:hypothetical protein
MNNTKMIRNNIALLNLVTYFFIALGTMHGENKNGNTFLTKANAIFVMKLDLYREILVDAKGDNDLEDRIEDLINAEIKSIEDWSTLYYKETVLPSNLQDVSLLAQGENSARIKSRIDEMKLVVMGFHKELGEEPSLINKIDVIKKLVGNLDGLAEKQVTELRSK